MENLDLTHLCTNFVLVFLDFETTDRQCTVRTEVLSESYTIYNFAPGGNRVKIRKISNSKV